MSDCGLTYAEYRIVMAGSAGSRRYKTGIGQVMPCSLELANTKRNH